MACTTPALLPPSGAPSLSSLGSRLAEIAVVVATTLTLATFLPRAAAAPVPHAVQAAPAESVPELCERVQPAVLFLTAMDAVPVSFAASGPASSTPGLGSAFVIDAAGTAITNHHVVVGHATVRALLGDGSEAVGRVLGSDPATDLAVLRLQVEPGRLHPLPLGDSAEVRVGQRVVVMGNPVGLTHSVTTGIVSATGRTLPAPDGRVISGVIQTDAATFQGSSGGPMLNTGGEVIGVVSATLGSYGFAVPIDTVKRVYPDLASRGQVARPWLGITGVGLSPAVASQLGFPSQYGVIVASVTRDGPADRAGIRGAEQLAGQPVEVASRFPIGGDVITAVDGRPVSSLDELASYLEVEKRPGETVTLEVLRLAVPLRVRVVLGERPEPEDAPEPFADRIHGSV